MADKAGTKNDGGVVFGSQILSIANSEGDDQDYIADAFSLKDGSDWFVRNDENGVPNGQVGRDTVPTGSATLQLADDTVLPPKKYAEFDALRVGGGTVTLIVAEVGEAFDQNGETKVTIEARLKLGT